MSGVFDNGDDVGAVGGHVDQVTTGAVGELNCKDYSLGAYYVRNVADGGSGGCTQVEDFASGTDEDLVEAAEDAGCKLAAEGVPDPVFSFSGRCSAICG